MCTQKKENMRKRADGFSLIELLVVLAIIMIMAAIAIPNVARFIRNYRINGAARNVAAEIQAARLKAIARNVRIGVIFAVLDQTSFRYVIEDDLRTGVAGNARWVTPDWDDLTATANEASQAGPVRQLPQGVQFTACTGQTPTTIGLKFRNLGTYCQLGATGCAAPTDAPTAPLLVSNSTTGACVGILEARTNLRRQITITPGGRVEVL
jgi:prepilin-type N-terminal cleavage/methylation domain-containing protein